MATAPTMLEQTRRESADRPETFEQLDAIMAVSAAVAQGGALPDTLDQIARAAAELLHAQAAAIILRPAQSETGLAVAGSFGLSESYANFLNATRPLEIGKGPSGLAAQHGCPVCIEDVLEDPIYAPWRELAVQENYRSMACVPLRTRQGRTIGVVAAYRADPGPWESRQVDLLLLLADHAAIAIRAADLLDQARRQVDGLSLMVRSLRAQAHEHSNRLHAIYGLLALGEAEEARRLVASVEEGYHSNYASVTKRIDNPTVAGLLVAEYSIARESGIELKLDRRSRLHELPPGVGDLDAVTVLGNLIHNAVDAVSSMSGVRRRVSVAILERPDEVLFRVRDWGPGIAREDLRLMFDRGFSTKDGHSGIGLALIKSIAGRVGGSVDVHSHDPGGLSVSVVFPR